ncbi:MAG: type III-A CRISPR-associated RAMP protein Csm5 [Bryobacterales bacterium]|nr:type III-A CRISPR-associated RAMP protein Csm5 [Bryobacterales bacterium]
MTYRLTCLTPLLVGDGNKLAPIDYMVWKDQVNVLDQRRIFRLLAKGPRLEGYLVQLKKADKLDFASWGGFAQNFADRRIAFEHPSAAQCWDRAQGESLFIPTFASGVDGPYLPATAIKGALRTAMFFGNLKPGSVEALAQRFQGDRPPRRPAEMAEEEALGPGGGSRMRGVSLGDSAPITRETMRVYLVRVATLLPAKGAAPFVLGWKQSPRGAAGADRPGESTAWFAEMAAPGTVFSGKWGERHSGSKGRFRPADRATVFRAANQYAAHILDVHLRYAAWTGLTHLEASLRSLREKLDALDPAHACLLPLGWGGGLLSKTPWKGVESPETNDYARILARLPYYARAVQSGLPFPKTRRVVFLENQPAALPGWSVLEVAENAPAS